MTQTWDIGSIDPATTSPATDITRITDGLGSLKSNFSGASLPATNLVGGMVALDTTNSVYWRRDPANTKWMLHASAADALVAAKSGAYTAVLGDFEKTLNCTGSWALGLSAAATLTDGWCARVINSGSGTITLDPNASETVNGAATLELYPGEDCFIVCDGSGFRVSRHAPLTGATFTGLVKLAAGANIASAATVNLSTATGNTVHITGTTATSAVTMAAGQWVRCIADGAWPLTYHATTNRISGGADYTCAAGDVVDYFYDGTTVIGHITRKDGKPVTTVEGTWTPANTTGLTLYGSQNYTRDGNKVTAQFDVGWPSTADAGAATITGFPVNAKATNFSCVIGYTTLGSAIYGRLNGGTLTFSNASGTDYTNANLSLKEVAGTITYLT